MRDPYRDPPFCSKARLVSDGREGMILSGSGMDSVEDSGDGGLTIPDIFVFIIETGAIDFTGTDFTGLGKDLTEFVEGTISSNSSTMDSFSDSGA
jgi:hypothetical protein